MKIVFAIKALIRPVGGAERSLTELANEMLRRGHEVEIVVNESAAHDSNARPFYFLDDPIAIHTVAKAPKTPRSPGNDDLTVRQRISRFRKQCNESVPMRFWNQLRRMPAYREYERKKWMRSRWPVVERWRDGIEALNPDVVVAFMPLCFTYVAQALRDSPIPLMVCYRNDPHFDHLPGRYMNNSYDDRMRLEAPHIAEKVCVQLDAYRSFFPSNAREKVVCIPNLVHPSPTRVDFEAREASRVKSIVSVGRLVPAKNHELLIRAFARLRDAFPDWRVDVYGEGPLETRLRRLVWRLGVEDRVALHAPVRDIGARLEASHLFAFPSLWEGFSRAHSEAMAKGLPSVGLRQCRYSSEFISESGSGLLSANDPTDFAEQLQLLMEDESLRAEMGNRAMDFVASFEAKSIFDQWEEMFFAASNASTFEAV